MADATGSRARFEHAQALVHEGPIKDAEPPELRLPDRERWRCKGGGVETVSGTISGTCGTVNIPHEASCNAPKSCQTNKETDQK